MVKQEPQGHTAGGGWRQNSDSSVHKGKRAGSRISSLSCLPPLDMLQPELSPTPTLILSSKGCWAAGWVHLGHRGKPVEKYKHQMLMDMGGHNYEATVCFWVGLMLLEVTALDPPRKCPPISL